jgi:hypothetical protein
MNWKWATALAMVCIGILLVMGAETAKADVTKPIPPGYRCGQVWLKCYKPGTAPRPPVKVPTPVRTGGTR